MPPRSPGLAVVTGASAGIGAALARKLSLAGRPVLAVARREDRLAALSDELRAAGGAPVHPLPLDLTSDGAAARVAAAAAERGGAAWLVNNAGFGYYGRFEEQGAEGLGALVRLNCEAVALLARALLPQLRASGEGVLLNVASAAAFQPTPFRTVYGATKAFVLSFSEALAEELRDSGVFVGAFCPGPVETEFGEISGSARRFRWKPSALSADDAAAEALEQIRRREVIRVPTRLYRFVSVAERIVPRAVIRTLAARAARPRRG